MAFKTQSYGISDIGLVRLNNEDVWAMLPSHQFYVLADGMGGHNAGEVAAREAVTYLCSAVQSALSTTHAESSPEKLAALLRQAILDTNIAVYRKSCESEELRGMGTTLCCFILHPDALIYAHVGDSRIYQFRKKQLTPLTRDHSLKYELLAKGHLEAGQLPSFAYKNVITRAIGTTNTVEPETDQLPIQSEDIYFLCSDGLTDNVSDQEITTILSQPKGLQDYCEELVSLAKQNGGNDNITVVMVQILL